DAAAATLSAERQAAPVITALPSRTRTDRRANRVVCAWVMRPSVGVVMGRCCIRIDASRNVPSKGRSAVGITRLDTGWRRGYSPTPDPFYAHPPLPPTRVPDAGHR